MLGSRGLTEKFSYGSLWVLMGASGTKGGVSQQTEVSGPLGSGLGPVQGHSNDAQARGTEAFFHPQFHFFHTDLAHERRF